MKQRKVIDTVQLPMRCPFIATLVLWLVLERLDATGWVWGVVGTLVAVIWIAWIVDVLNRDNVKVIP